MTEVDCNCDTTQGEPCPRWCIAEHDHQGDAHHRWHFGACRELPLVELIRGSGDAAPEEEVSLLLDVCLERPWGCGITYLLIGVGADRARTFRLTLESAERLATAVRDVAREGRKCP